MIHEKNFYMVTYTTWIAAGDAQNMSAPGGTSLNKLPHLIGISQEENYNSM